MPRREVNAKPCASSRFRHNGVVVGCGQFTDTIEPREEKKGNTQPYSWFTESITVGSTRNDKVSNEDRINFEVSPTKASSDALALIRYLKTRATISTS